MPIYPVEKVTRAHVGKNQLIAYLAILALGSACRDARPSLVPPVTARPSQTPAFALTATSSPNAPLPPSFTATTLPKSAAALATPTVATTPTAPASPTASATATSTETSPTASATATPTLEPTPTATPTAAPPSRDNLGQPTTLLTPDGLALAATIYAPAGDGPFPGVVLSHMSGGTQGDWDALPEALRQAGYIVLTFDFRGHGESEGNLDPPSAALDLTTALSYLRTLPEVATGQIGLVGASMGGMTSVIVGADNPDVRTVVGISTSPGAGGQNPIAVIGRLSPRPFLAIGCTGDPLTRPERVTELFNAAGEPKQLILLDCDAHANDIFGTAAGQELSDQLQQWLDAHLLDHNP
jgi:dienelactone hydrolase